MDRLRRSVFERLSNPADGADPLPADATHQLGPAPAPSGAGCKGRRRGREQHGAARKADPRAPGRSPARRPREQFHCPSSSQLARPQCAAPHSLPPAPPPSHRVALTHPLISRQLLPSLARGQQPRRQACTSEQGGTGSSTQPASATHQQREGDQQQAQQVVPGPPNSARGVPLQMQLQLRQVQSERDAAEEMLQQMVQQTQALLRDKQHLQQQAAALAAQKQQLEERLEYLLVDQEEEWEEEAGVGEGEEAGVGEGLQGDQAAAAAALGACGGGSSGGGTMQPTTPSAEAAKCVMEALQGRLHALSDERQRLLLLLDLHTRQGQAAGGSSGSSSNGGSGGSSPTAGPSAVAHPLES